MRGLLVALLLSLGVGNAGATDKYIDAGKLVSADFRSVVAFNVTGGATYKFSGLFLFEWPDGISTFDTLHVQTRFGGSALGELVTDSAITSRGQVATSSIGHRFGLTDPIRLSGTFKATTSGTFTVQMRHGTDLEIRRGSIMSMSEVEP